MAGCIKQIFKTRLNIKIKREERSWEKVTVTPCDIEGLYVIEPTVFKDERGYFVETYNPERHERSRT